MRMSFLTAMMFALTVSMGVAALAVPADFDDLSLTPESYWNGSDFSGGFSSGPAFFNNSFTDWGGGFTSWEGFAYSNLSQECPPLKGFAGQYTALPGTGQSGSNYAVGYVGYGDLPRMTFARPLGLSGAYFTNNNYTYFSMLNGDGFAKQFGGASGDDPDWFCLSIEGFDQQNNSTGTVDFYLADYRFDDHSQDYIVPGWSWVDLSGLGVVQEVTFNLSSSDSGAWGMNTPAYFAMDTVVPKPLDVEVDIRPHSPWNRINPRSRGLLPVAVLSSEDFDVHDIDLLSLELAGAEPRRRGPDDGIGFFRDYNHDSYADLILGFGIPDLEIEADTTELVLEGLLNDGTAFMGIDSICVVCPGDVNGDGFVGGADLSVIINNWGLQDASFEEGDLDGDGIVSGSDYSEVLSYWGTGRSSPPEAPASVPEPTACLLLCLGALALFGRRR